MSPAKFNNNAHQSNINGPRPSPLKINKSSQLIHKQSSSSLNSPSSSSSNNSVISAANRQQQVQRNNPVIIYTHSPKVIHTQARDFMALVQKLTGLSSSGNDNTTQQQRHGGGVTNQAVSKSKLGGLGNENCSGSGGGGVGCSGGGSSNNDGGGIVYSSINSPILNPPKNPYLADIPLFTPTSVDYLCSSRPVYRFSDSAYTSPSIASNSISPSALDFIKGFPEY